LGTLTGLQKHAGRHRGGKIRRLLERITIHWKKKKEQKRCVKGGKTQNTTGNGFKTKTLGPVETRPGTQERKGRGRTANSSTQEGQVQVLKFLGLVKSKDKGYRVRKNLRSQHRTSKRKRKTGP